MADSQIKELRIKSGVVKRLAKERRYYQEEADALQKKIEEFRSDGKDEYEISKLEETLQESLNMVKDCGKRLLPAFDQLKKLIDKEELVELEEFKAGMEILENVKFQHPSLC